MPPKKVPKLDHSQRKLSTFLRTNSEPAESEDHANDTAGEASTSRPSSNDVRKFHSKWLTLWPWLTFEEDALYCKICLKHGKKNTMTAGCRTFKTSSMTRHEESTDHKHAQAAGELSVNFEAAVSKALSDEDEGMIKAMKVVYWLASENLPLTKYESTMQLMKDLEVPKIECLKVSERVEFESYYTANEILSSISTQIDEDVNEKIARSPFVTMLADESTDIANKKRMTMHARIVDPKTSVAETVYLRDVEYEDGTGEGLTNEILNEAKKRNIPPSKIIGFGSDGATVMTGEGKGVKGRLKEQNAHMVHIHCMAHRLALCTSQAATDIPRLKKYQEWLTSLFYYLKASATKEKELHKVQDILDHPVLKYKEIHAVRWLSCYEAVEAVYRTLDPLLSYFHQRNASKDPKAKGLLKAMASTQFIFTTYLMMDVLPIVSRLCLQLQAENLDVAKAKVSVDQCLDDLQAYRNGKQKFPTHTERFDKDIVQINGHHEFKGHIVRGETSSAGFEALKATFLDQLIANINKRFPKKSLMSSFFVLAMRSINFEKDPGEFGNTEMEELLKHFGEGKVHKGKHNPPVLSKVEVRREWARAKSIVISLHYPVDHMKELWQILTTHHSDDLPNLIKLAQIALLLPLHTADCERAFSAQNLILTKLRSRLAPEISDKLLRVRMHGKGLKEHDFSKTLVIWHQQKKRLLKAGPVTHTLTKGI